jgi:hypothetical protein
MDNTTDDSPSHRRMGWFSLGRRSAASWSKRASNEASSALAPTPGVAEEAGRQGTPEPGVATAGAAETSASDPPVELPTWRDPAAPPLPALLNRKRTIEKRDQEKTIRFTPTAVQAITVAAQRRGQKFAGFVGDAALAVALGHTDVQGSPEDDPMRPLIEAIEAHTVALNRIGNNLNQITAAIHQGTIPEHAEAVLTRVEQAASDCYRMIDQLLAEGAPHGS